MEGDYKHSRPLITQLHGKNVHVLAHVKRVDMEMVYAFYSIYAYDLGLMKEVKIEWEDYVPRLSRVGVFLSKEVDILVWDSGNTNGGISLNLELYKGSRI